MSKFCQFRYLKDNRLSKCGTRTNDGICKTHQDKIKHKDDCSICLEAINISEETPLDCGHWFHKQCIIPTNIHECPLCRQTMNKEMATWIFGEGHTSKNKYNDGDSIYIGNDDQFFEYTRTLFNVEGLTTRSEINERINSVIHILDDLLNHTRLSVGSSLLTSNNILTLITEREEDAFIFHSYQTIGNEIEEMLNRNDIENLNIVNLDYDSTMEQTFNNIFNCHVVYLLKIMFALDFNDSLMVFRSAFRRHVEYNVRRILRSSIVRI